MLNHALYDHYSLFIRPLFDRVCIYISLFNYAWIDTNVKSSVASCPCIGTHGLMDRFYTLFLHFLFCLPLRLLLYLPEQMYFIEWKKLNECSAMCVLSIVFYVMKQLITDSDYTVDWWCSLIFRSSYVKLCS